MVELLMTYSFLYIFSFSILYKQTSGFPGGTSSKEPACQYRRHKKFGFDPWVRSMPWKRSCNPLQYFCLETPKDRRTWRAAVHRVTKSRAWLKQLSTHAHMRKQTSLLEANKNEYLEMYIHLVIIDTSKQSWGHRGIAPGTVWGEA